MKKSFFTATTVMMMIFTLTSGVWYLRVGGFILGIISFYMIED